MPSEVLRSRPWNYAKCVGLLAGAALVGAGVPDRSSLGDRALLLALALVLAVVALRCLTLGVWVAGDRLVMRSAFFTTRIRCDAIKRVRLVTRRPKGLTAQVFLPLVPVVSYVGRTGAVAEFDLDLLAGRHRAVGQHYVETIQRLVHAAKPGSSGPGS